MCIKDISCRHAVLHASECSKHMSAVCPPQVHVAPHGDSLATRETMEIHCGQGNQILQWLAQAACARLAHRRGGQVLQVQHHDIMAWTAAASSTTVKACRNHTGYHQCAGESLGYYVPQSVLDKDGRVLDIDLVLSEAVADGGEVVVEYGAGPLAFRSRYAAAETWGVGMP